MKISTMLLFFLVVFAVSLGSCNSKPTSLPAKITLTPAPVVGIHLEKNYRQENLPQWADRCAKDITASKTLADLPTLQPETAIVLLYDMKTKQWEFNHSFSSLINSESEPKYLICIYARWARTTEYRAGSKTIPGYREDRQLIVQNLENDQIYSSPFILGKELSGDFFYNPASSLTEVVGLPPSLDFLLLPDSKSNDSAALSKHEIPYGWQCLNFSPDGKSIYYCVKNDFFAWDFIGNQKAPFIFHDAPIECERARTISTSFDGRFIITSCFSGKDYTLDIYSSDTLKRLWQGVIKDLREGQYDISGQNLILSARQAGTYQVEKSYVELNTGKQQRVIEEVQGEIKWISNSGDYVITAVKDKNYNQMAWHLYQLWNLVEHKLVNQFEFFGYLGGEQLSRDGRMLVLMKEDSRELTLQVLNTQTMYIEIEVSIPQPKSKYTISPDGRLLAVMGYYEVYLIDLQAKRVIKKIPIANVTSLLFSPDGKYIALPDVSIYGKSNYSPVTVAIYETGLP